MTEEEALVLVKEAEGTLAHLVAATVALSDQRQDLEGELVAARQKAADDVLTAQLAGKSTAGKARRVVEIDADLAALRSAIEEAGRREKRARAGLCNAKAALLRTRAASLREEAAARQAWVDERLRAIEEYEGVRFVPSLEVTTSGGVDASVPAYIMDGVARAQTKTGRLLSEAENLETSARLLEADARRLLGTAAMC